MNIIRNTILTWLFTVVSASWVVYAAVTIIGLYETSIIPGSNTLDSIAFWVSKTNPDSAMMFVTAKQTDNLEVHDPNTNQLITLFGNSGSGPGEFNYPNGVVVGYDFNLNGRLTDVLMVIERDNHRVSVYELPHLNYLGIFGQNDLVDPYGGAVYNDGSDLYVYITENDNQDRCFIYRIHSDSGAFEAELIKSFPANATTESVIIDGYHRRVFLCDEGSPSAIKVFSLWGDTLITTIGNGIFQADAEGIVLYDCGNGEGFLIVSDQQSPTEFEVFDRQTLAHLGNFVGGGITPTRGTDGIGLTQRYLTIAPFGMFAAVDGDRQVHTFDVMSIITQMNLCYADTAKQDIAVTPVEIDFDSVRINSYTTQTFSIINEGERTLHVRNMAFQGNDSLVFQIIDGGGAFDLLPGQLRDVTIKFDPDSLGFIQGNLKIFNNDPDESEINVALLGTGLIPAMQMNFSSGWNMVGIPLDTQDTLAWELFPDYELHHAFTYRNHYVQTDTLVPGEGYWIYFRNNSGKTMEGMNMTNIFVPLAEGWNLISGPSCDIDISSVLDPGETVGSSFFGYNGGYTAASIIETGKAYWVYAAHPDTIYLDCQGSVKKSGISYADRLPDLSSENTVVVSDASGNSQQLYWMLSQEEGDAVRQYRLPPKMLVENIFDVRFSDDTYATVSETPEMLLQTGDFPLTLSFDRMAADTPGSYELVALLGEYVTARYPVAEGQTITISDPRVQKVRLEQVQESIPESFAVFQNYPNPFNPETTLRFTLPQTAKVSITIYNSLGQHIRTLLDDTAEAGMHEIKWDGSDDKGRTLVSGIYYYTVRSDRHQITRKMILVR